MFRSCRQAGRVVTLQVNVFLKQLNGDPIGFSVMRIFVIDKTAILSVSGDFHANWEGMVNLTDNIL